MKAVPAKAPFRPSSEKRRTRLLAHEAAAVVEEPHAVAHDLAGLDEHLVRDELGHGRRAGVGGRRAAGFAAGFAALGTPFGPIA